MGALGRYLEEEGISTTQISLIREHTEAIRPPRALWVPFILGRPLGVPNDPPFQRRVLLAALELLNANSGPVLADFLEEAPADNPEEAAGFACPVQFSKMHQNESIDAQFLQEIVDLSSWHHLAMERRGRTSMGLSGMEIKSAALVLIEFINSRSIDRKLTNAPADFLRLVCHDIRAYYTESVAAQPGKREAKEIQEWFWEMTKASKVMMLLRDACVDSNDPALNRFGERGVVPSFIANRAR